MNKGSAEESNVFWKRVSIPKGLPSLLEILAKETIRENPKDIIAFLSKLVDDLIGKILLFHSSYESHLIYFNFTAI